MGNVFSWVEIPVLDIERAAKFYGQLLGREVSIIDMPPRRMATLYFEPATSVGRCCSRLTSSRAIRAYTST